MRSYWLKILLGALGVFIVGMIGVTIVRSGIAKVNSVVEGDGPITVPLGLIPFAIGGERLGRLDHVTLHRDSPNRVTEVELEVELTDSLLAHGLAGCRLVANIEDDEREQGVDVRIGRGSAQRNAFSCLAGDSTPADFVEYGVAVFNPGDVEVPLFLPTDVVAELQHLDFSSDSATGEAPDEISVPDTDSIAAEVERQLDSAIGGRRPGESRQAVTRRFADSIRAEAQKRLAEEGDQQ